MAVILNQSGSPLLDENGVPLFDFDDTGSVGNFAARLRSVLPDRWFGDDAPILGAILAGMGAVFVPLWDLIQFTSRQTRVLTVEGSFLDMAAADFRGTTLVRRLNETDAAFRARLLPILPRRVTRASVVARLAALGCTGTTVFEPLRAGDTGGYGLGMGYGSAGAYGSLSLPAQFFTKTHRPSGRGFANVAGYGTSAAGYGVGLAEYVPASATAPTVTDADIYAAISDTAAAGVIAWTAIL